MKPTSHLSKKLIQPTLSPTTLHRRALVQTLQNVVLPLPDQEEAYKLVLLSAPAGYGKTVLLADFAAHTQLQCSWYFLDRSDHDIWIFIEFFIASIRTYYPNFGCQLDQRLMQARVATLKDALDCYPLAEMTDALLAALESDISERLAIFLCNYHQVHKNEEIRFFMNRLLLKLPCKCIIIIESRILPALELTTLMAAEYLFSIGSNDLRFTSQDVLALLGLKNLEVLEEKAEQVTLSFKGWIAGILLSIRLDAIQILSFPASRSARDPLVISTSQQALFSYFMNDVLKQEPDIYTFLRETSLLHELIPEFCDKLLGATHAEEILTYIEQYGLFVTMRERGARKIYICHPILRELLYSELSQQHPKRKKQLHRCAAYLFFARQDHAQALNHAQASEDYETAVAIILTISPHLLAQGCTETITRGIDVFPPAIFERYPQLLLLRAKMYLLSYDYLKARPLLEQTRLLIEQQPTTPYHTSRRLLAEVFIAQSRIFFHDGCYDDALAQCQEADSLLSDHETDLRALVLYHMGLCSSLQGHQQIGIVQMQQALHLWKSQEESIQAANIHNDLARAYNMTRNLALAEHHFTRAIAICGRFNNIRGHIYSMIEMATLKYNKGEIEASIDILNEIVSIAREEHFLNGEAYALFYLSRTYQQRGAFQKALVLSENALKLAYKIGDRYLINCLLCNQATIYCFMNDPHTASFLINQLQVKTRIVTSYEAFYRDLTRGTILLLQERYHEACNCFTDIENKITKDSNCTYSIATFVRLAASQVSLGRYEQARLSMQRASALALQSSAEHIVQIEVCRFSIVQQVLPSQSELIAPATSTSADHPLARESEQPIQISPIQSPAMRMLALGVPLIVINNTPIMRWRMSRSQELYFFLLNHRHPIHKEQIIATLWPDEGESIDQTLRSAVYYLRKAIGEKCLVRNGNIYELNLAVLYGKDYWYDVAEFEQQYTQVQLHLANKDDSSAYAYITHMLKIYRGDYLCSFYSNWCIPRRDELRRIYLSIRKEIAFITWRNEQFEECLQHWQQFLCLDDCSEEAHYGLMRCYMRMGKRELAIRQYQSCQEILQKEFSTIPGLAMRKLHQRLVQNSLP